MRRPGIIERRAPGSNVRVPLLGGGGGGTPAAFTPTDIAGLVCWFDMLDPTAFTELAGVITSLTNKASSVVWNSGTLPNYSATAMGAGKPGIDFVAASSHFIMDSEAAVWQALDDASAHTLAFRASPDRTNATEHIVGVADAAQAVNRCRHWGNSSTALWRQQSINDAGTTVTVLSGGASSTGSKTFLWSSPGTTVSLSVDGGAADPNAAALNPGTLTPTRTALGCRPRTTPDQFYDGKFGELLLYNSDLSAGDKALVVAYLERWD